MANLTAHRTLKTREAGPYEARRYRIKNGQQLYEGGYLMLEVASGNAQPFVAGAGAVAIGRALPTRKDVDAATYLKGDTTLSPPPEVIVFVGSEILEDVSVVGVVGQTDEHALVYLLDDNLLTLTAGANGKPLGRVVRYRATTYVDVRVFSLEERALQAG